MEVVQKQSFDINKVRSDFPVLKRMVSDNPWIYLDNAATSQKPKSVIDALLGYYSYLNSNVHRGVHTVSQEATDAFEASRRKIQEFINAKSDKEIIFTSGTTGSINLVASSFGRAFINEGDEVIISTLEHHSNIVPWQMICQEKGAKLKIIPIDDNGNIDVEEYKSLLSDRTKLVSITHVSNALGIINPVKEVVDLAHQVDVPVLLDGAQAVPHMTVDVQDLNCDFYCFSSHKMFGPTGVGVLYGKEYWLNKMPPYQGGGEMIKTVTFEKTDYNEIPFKFEAGTPNIADDIALIKAIEYINEIGREAIEEYEKTLLQRATELLLEIDGLKIYGNVANKVPVVSFNVDGVHSYDLGVILDKMGIAIRTGHHCTEPLMKRLEVNGTARASFAFYNTIEEVEKLAEGVKKAVSMLR